MAEVKCVRVLISGKVQGVAFRHATHRQAETLGLGGWVRNLADGRVEAVFRGNAEQVEDMLAWCRHGPPAARVVALAVFDQEPGGDLGGFVIHPTSFDGLG